MSWISILDITGTLGILTALFFIPGIPVNRIGYPAKRFLTLSILIYLFIGISNVLQNMNITSRLDDFEGPVSALFFPFVLFFFYAVWLWQETQRRLNAEKHLNELNAVLHSEQQVNKLLSEQTKSIEEDFSRAAEIMQTLLPIYAPAIAGTSVCAIHRPSHQVGGDLYDIVQLDSSKIVIFVADATGHGVASALLAMLFKNQLRLGDEGKLKLLKPAEYLEDINNKLVESCQGTGMFITAVCGVVDLQNNILKIVSAGHPPAILQHSTNSDKAQLLYTGGQALGLKANARYYEKTIQLKTGDRLLMYTDGVFCQNGTDENSPVDRITKLFEESNLHGINLLNKISEDMHCDGEISDDVTLLLLELSPGLSQMKNYLQVAQSSRQPVNEQKQCQIAVGGSEKGIFLHLYGKVIWTCAVSFNEICSNAINEARSSGVTLFLDFQNCKHLDSTILGTIYELIAKAESYGLTIYFQNISRRLKALFEELGMNRVLVHIKEISEPLPSHMTLQEVTSDTQLSPERILKAHETLSAVNEHNQKMFGFLVKSLRKEIRANHTQSKK